MKFKKASKLESKLKLAFIGPAGSGKTYSALSVGCALAKLVNARVALIDTERGSASLYADIFDFDALELESFSPLSYIEAIKAAEKAGYGVIVVDSLSHAWTGKEGALEQVDRFAKREKENSFGAWRHVTPMHNLMVDAIVSSSSHLIATMRVKTEYVLERNEKTGKTTPRKVGLAPVQRDGLEYEFSIVGDLDIDNGFTVTKTRCPPLTGAYIEKPGAQLAEALVAWLRGAPRPEPAPSQKSASTETDPAMVADLLSAMLVLIDAAETEADLDALVPDLKVLPDPPLSEARETWLAKRAEIRRLESDKTQKRTEDATPTVRLPGQEMPDETPRGNAAAKAALQRAMGGGKVP